MTQRESPHLSPAAALLRRFSRIDGVVAVAILSMVCSTAFALLDWRRHNVDLDLYVVPWFENFLAHGRFDALAESFANYNPPYLYLLSISTLAANLAGADTIIRSLSLFFVLVSGWPVYRLARGRGWTAPRARWATVAWIVAPEVLLNSLVWGQCDVIYTAALMASIVALIERNGALAMALYGVALGFKLQAVFIAPFYLWVVLSGLVRWRQAVLAPLAFVVLLVPAAVAGRPWGELLTIYVGQVQTFHLMSKRAPNAWALVQAVFPGVNHEPAFHVLTKVAGALAVAACAALIAAVGWRRRQPTPAQLVAVALLSSMVVPYLLPLMHERYFFPAGAFSVMLAVLHSEFLGVAILVQLANCLAYTGFLRYATKLPVLGAVLMTGALCWLLGLIVQRGLFAGMPRGGPRG